MSVDPTVLRVLERAIQAEIEGFHFYTMAAGASTDPGGKGAFLALAEEEQRHAEFLRGQHRALMETGAVDPALDLGTPLRFDAGRSFFSDAIRDRAAQAHFEMTALSVAAQLEADAMRFYREEAERSLLPEVAAFLRQLAAWELGHHDTLVAQMRALEEDYWAVNRFAPF